MNTLIETRDVIAGHSRIIAKEGRRPAVSYRGHCTGCDWTTHVLTAEYAALLHANHVAELVEDLLLGSCICDTGPDTDGPDEECPRHGRTRAEWITRGDLLTGRIELASQRVYALTTRFHAGSFITADDLMDVRDVLAGRTPQ